MFDINRLGELRKKMGLTQSQFAKQAGVSQSLIAKIEAKSIDPSYSNVLKIEETIANLTKIKEPDARTIMTNKIIFTNPEIPAINVINIMKKHKISQLPVFKHNGLVGLISENSILEKDISKIKILKARDIMTDIPPIVSDKTKMSVIAALLKQFPIIIIRKGTEYAGVITKADLLNAIT